MSITVHLPQPIGSLRFSPVPPLQRCFMGHQAERSITSVQQIEVYGEGRPPEACKTKWERERERQTDRQRDRQTHKHTHTHTHTARERERERERVTGREVQRETQRQRESGGHCSQGRLGTCLIRHYLQARPSYDASQVMGTRHM